MKRYHWLTTSILLALLLLSCNTVNNDQKLTSISGNYGSLTLAYNPKTQLVSGYYQNYTGFDETTGNPRFSCIFYFSGKLTGNNAEIKSWYPMDENPEVITGILQVTKENEVSIQLNSEHGGCWNVEKFTETPATFTRDSSTQWIAIQMAKSSKTFFYSSPDAKSKLKSYVITGDLLKVLSEENEWAKIEYSSSKKTTQAWVKKSDLFPSVK